MQGNIVSRKFVEKVLDFPQSTFLKLTEEEERGGTGINGDSHVPLGAINLTWYHNNSTRVFYDMRFLISPAQHCDLIIGAQSIQRDNILNVPCLMVDKDDIILKRPAGPPSPGALSTPYFLTPQPLTNSQDTAIKTLNKLLADKKSELTDTDIARKALGGRNFHGRLDFLKKTCGRLEEEIKVLDWTRQLCDTAPEKGEAHGNGEAPEKEEGDKQTPDSLLEAIGRSQLNFREIIGRDVWDVIEPMLPQLWTDVGNTEPYNGPSKTTGYEAPK